MECCTEEAPALARHLTLCVSYSPPLQPQTPSQVEGNYLFLEEDPWCQLRELFDDSWFVDVDLDTAMQRVYERQVAIGVAPETSRVRIASNDRPNGELVNATRHVARVLVPSSIPFASSVDEE